ncbi:hypothetical protein Bamb_6266 [Burkholderia ambifaria AMMD]|uniref:Uncharacterized protein n=1 Tax=Burkholderia ambifaria (strain ATCC BAA-244 / DSM 16087 / CCUG 44356 / LMG 19182 / AMMD) TaxID=339670 RepID=Q0B213_BURCM|nr:hypothetical protein Bamb_6266 [Burkholderia ambifaria AMMD]
MDQQYSETECGVVNNRQKHSALRYKSVDHDWKVDVERPRVAELGGPPPSARDRRRSTHCGQWYRPIAVVHSLLNICAVTI